MTDATSAGRFPADEPLSSLGVRQLSEMAGQFRADVAVCGSELRVRQTAQGLGLRATVEPRLSDLDAGSWRGALLDDIDAADIHLWLTDVTAAPPGGESVADLLARIGDWMRSLTEGPARVVAVTHPSVVRAAILVALHAQPSSFWRIDVAPMSRVVLHHRGAGWTLRV